MAVPKVSFDPAVELSAIHASIVVATGGVCTDPKTEAALVKPATDINTRLVSASVNVGVFWNSLFREVMAGQSGREACPGALAAADCNPLLLDPTAAAVTSRLDECRLSFQRRFPKLRDQLKLRAGPLTDRWQSFGPGLLIQIADRIWQASPPTGWWPTQVPALLVQPMRGGDGGYDGSSRVWIEAMLTDAHPGVGEVFRLAYWVARIAIDQHLGATQAPSDPDDMGSSGSTSALPWDLGCVPIVLDAAVKLDLIGRPHLPVADAVQLWRLGDAPAAEAVASWWTQWADSEAPIPVALKALANQLEPLRESPKPRRAGDLERLADLDGEF
ncbi:MAG: hypothetical protein AAFU85_32535 [Planctomycetota bacterium]